MEIRCRSTLATDFFIYIKYNRLLYAFHELDTAGLSGKKRSTNNRFKTTFRSFTVKAREGMHERRQSIEISRLVRRCRLRDNQLCKS